MSNKPILAYWQIRGLAGPIRLLLAYCKVDFEDKHFVCGDGPEFNRECWTKVKFSLGLPFPNLPYYIDGDKKITQSNAILRYIARKHDLVGMTEDEKIAVDIMENQLMDFRNAFIHLCYGPNYEDNAKKYRSDSLPNYLKLFSEFLGKKKYFAGDKVTFVDFVAYELFDQNMAFDKQAFDKYDNLKAFHKRVRDLPAIDAYYKSEKFGNGVPINNKTASFK